MTQPNDELATPVVGVFVGGRGLRMGGVSKALLPASHGEETLAERLVRVASEAGLVCVLAGKGEVAASLSHLPRLHDEPEGEGPLGGLGALLSYAQSGRVIALACDMAFVSAGLLRTLATRASRAQVLAPRDPATGRWQSFFARYDVAPTRAALAATLAAGERSFQALLSRLHTEELVLTPSEHEELADWDRPEDLRR